MQSGILGTVRLACQEGNLAAWFVEVKKGANRIKENDRKIVIMAGRMTYR